jgi:hypothetical protein
MGSTPLNGSSSINSFGCVTSERAIVKRLFSPPLNVSAVFLAIRSMPNWCSS